MKKITLLLIFMMLSALKLIGQNAIIYSDFEGVNTVNYAGYLTSMQTVSNPSKTGINTSNNVGKVISSNNLYENIYNTNTLSTIDFSQRQIFKLKVYSPRIAYVVMEIRNATKHDFSNFYGIYFKGWGVGRNFL